MAMSGHLLQLKPPGSLRLRLSSSSSSVSGTPNRPTQCNSRARVSLGPIAAASHLEGAGRLRYEFLAFGGGLRRKPGLWLGLGCREVAAAASGDAEAVEAKDLGEEVRDEGDPEEISSFPEEFKDLTVDRGDPPNVFLYAAVLCVIVLMRDVILQEIASWGINFARVALYIAEGIIIGLGKLTNVAAEPLAFLMAVMTWAIMAVDQIYTFIVDGAPLRALLETLFLSLAVISIGDAAASKVKGSRYRLVGISAALGLGCVLEFIPPQAIFLSLVLLTVFAKFIQKADSVTMFMPVTVMLGVISEPILQATVLGIFLAVSVYANWRAAEQPIEESSEQTPSEMRDIKASAGKRPSFVFSAITASICISLAARFLYVRTLKWLLVRSL